MRALGLADHEEPAMPNRLHDVENGAVFFVTNRCEQERFFLKPSPEVFDLTAAWLAKAAERFPQIELFGFIFLSNHLHLLLRDPGGLLAPFMEYLQGQLAKAVNRQLRRRGHFFAREYDAVPVLTEQDFDERYAYILTNAVKAGLVARAADAPFFSSLPIALDEKPRTFRWLDRTNRHNRTRRGQSVDDRDFVKAYTLRLSIPQHWRAWSRGRRRRHIEQLVRANEERYGKQRKAEGHSVLGRQRILEMSPFMRPKSPDRRPRVKVFCKDLELKKAFLAARKEAFDRYRRTYSAWLGSIRRGTRAIISWPAGCYPPSASRPVGAMA